MEHYDILYVSVGGLAGGFVAGLAGFGTGITALGIWLYVLSPSVAATLVIVCSLAAQLQTLPKIVHSIEIERVWPFIVPGLLGVPLGTILLSAVDVSTFKLAIGVLLLVYSVHTLVYRSRAPIHWGGRKVDAAIGFGGGILGGLAGLSGPLPTVWADVRGWTKAQRRAVFQSFNLTILSVSIVAHFLAGFITAELITAAAAALPGTFVGAWLGVRLYARVSDSRFREIILSLLCVSGCGLIWTSL